MSDHRYPWAGEPQVDLYLDRVADAHGAREGPAAAGRSDQA